MAGGSSGALTSEETLYLTDGMSLVRLTSFLKCAMLGGRLLRRARSAALLTAFGSLVNMAFSCSRRANRNAVDSSTVPSGRSLSVFSCCSVFSSFIQSTSDSDSSDDNEGRLGSTKVPMAVELTESVFVRLGDVAALEWPCLWKPSSLCSSMSRSSVEYGVDGSAESSRVMSKSVLCLEGAHGFSRISTLLGFRACLVPVTLGVDRHCSTCSRERLS